MRPRSVLTDPLTMPWRTGRKVGRTIYAQTADEPNDHDALIGVMDTRELADHAVKAHNAVLKLQQDWGAFVQ
jgi:hypothetical protein